MNNKASLIGLLITIVIIGIIVLVPFIGSEVEKISESREFYLISSTSNRFMDQELRDYAKKHKIDLSIDYFGDLEIVDKLNSDSNYYDAVWISNSIWLYMLNNSSSVTDSKSIAIDPVVMAVKKSKVRELGLDRADLKNSDILELIREKRLNYVMSSVTKTNTGATAYLGFLNSLAGSPEVLTSDMLKDENLITNMRTFFTGVERVSGDEEYLENMFLSGEYDAMINYESSIIKINEILTNENKEPLYLLYPVDGVAINDMPFAYVNRNQEKRDNFLKLQNYLRSEDVSRVLEEKGIRSWYGGTKSNADKNVFKRDWGIDTTKYLIPQKYPSKAVITDAMDLYIEQLRKPTHTVFCLDVSGSMVGAGIYDLRDAMLYILDREQARVDKLQFSPYDKITVITFNSGVQRITKTFMGNDTVELRNYINNLRPAGGTNIYNPSIEALKILKDTSDEYTKTVILMTDGESNNGTFTSLRTYYNTNKLTIPIYSIMFGDSSMSQLSEIEALTNARIFDGKEGLKEAFKEVRSYN